MRKKTSMVSMVLATSLSVTGTLADMAIETVVVGNPGNVADTRYETSGYGSVGHTYKIGKYEVTAGQYTTFLNAVASTDPYALYSSAMWTNGKGCKINRHGSPGSYTYTVATEWADRPVNYVSWGDAARFANWLHNGKGSSDTETGSYNLNGATGVVEQLAVSREPDATWVIPSEDEWYKAAYHKNDGVTGNYFEYPTGSDTVPSNDLTDPDLGNNATFYDGIAPDQDGYTIESTYYRTEVGAHEFSSSPYGTFDQGGNVFEWNDTIVSGSHGLFRGARGGGFGQYDYAMHASVRANHFSIGQPRESAGIGFRVALVPEPSSIILIVFGSLLLTRSRQ